jgi:putative ATP-dependent endonuclease of OLD family
MICVEEVKILNYKCFENFKIVLNKNLNIIVGNNEEGKSTILEALHLALSGLVNGKSIYSEISENIFNRDVVKRYLESLKTENKEPLPYILIEVYLGGENIDIFEGDANYYKSKHFGLALKISFDEQYQNEYHTLLQGEGEINTIPVEYYKVERYSFARDAITNKSIPLKSVIIDSSSNKFQNGSDMYISKIIKDNLDDNEIIALTQSYRKLKEKFGRDGAIDSINKKVSENAGISNKKVSISVDMSVKSSWETILMTLIDEIPFQQVGKGEQCMVKTNLALAHQKAQTSNLILIEEPENHLSHTNLNVLLDSIIEKCKEKQLIITTHSNFVANKLNLTNLILLSDKNTVGFNELAPDDAAYFQKLPGYDTLRLILSKSAILVEGPSDELIIQKAFKDKFESIPIQKGIDVISVKGLSFKRFLELAKRLQKKVAVVTDNDGDFGTKIQNKYKEYLDCSYIKICASKNNDLKTLEPQFADANKDYIDTLRTVIGANEKQHPNIVEYMIDNKTEWALKVFNSNNKFNYPQYIQEALKWTYGEE